MSDHQKTTQAIITERAAFLPHKTVERFALFNEDGTPYVYGQQGAPIVTGSAIGTVGKSTTADEPIAGQTVAIKFTNGNSATSPTMAFNGGSARAMQLGGVASAAAKLAIAANGVALFYFDGTVLHQVGAYT